LDQHTHDHHHADPFAPRLEAQRIPRIGIGGPVGSGKTALIERLAPLLLTAGCPPLVINKIDLAPYVGASLEVMERDSRIARGDRPFVFTTAHPARAWRRCWRPCSMSPTRSSNQQIPRWLKTKCSLPERRFACPWTKDKGWQTKDSASTCAVRLKSNQRSTLRRATSLQTVRAAHESDSICRHVRTPGRPARSAAGA
jgi:hypothetical protein